MDLSKLLGDVYDEGEGEGGGDGRGDSEGGEQEGSAVDTAPAATSGPAGPDWADDAHLDEVFASWTPGPPDDAPSAEREMARMEPSGSPLDDDLAAALSAALLEAESEDQSEVSSSGEPGDDPAAGTAETALTQPVAAGPAEAETDWVPPPSPPPAPPVAEDRPWTRSDDDVLPRRGGRRLALRRR